MTSHSRPQLIIGDIQMARLEDMAGAQLHRSPALAEALLHELERATCLPQAEVPDDVVQVGSRLSYREDEAAAVQSIRLVWPEEADIAQGKISVLTPLGFALIGLRPQASFFWQTRREIRREFVILDVFSKASGRVSSGKRRIVRNLF